MKTWWMNLLFLGTPLTTLGRGTEGKLCVERVAPMPPSFSSSSRETLGRTSQRTQRNELSRIAYWLYSLNISWISSFLSNYSCMVYRTSLISKICISNWPFPWQDIWPCLKMSMEIFGHFWIFLDIWIFGQKLGDNIHLLAFVLYHSISCSWAPVTQTVNFLGWDARMLNVSSCHVGR